MTKVKKIIYKKYKIPIYDQIACFKSYTQSIFRLDKRQIQYKMSSQFSQNTLIYLKGQGIIPTQQSAINSKAQSLQLLNSTNLKANWNPSSNILIHLSNNRYYYGLLLNMTEATCKSCIYIFENGAFYQGSIKNGKFQGKGQLIRYSSDFQERMSSYKGDWINGKPHGFGKQFILNSMIYQGFFRQGRKHGKGKLVYKDESYYNGQFKDNKIQGYGVYKTAIHQWTGFWKEGYLEGQGEQITFGDNQQYQGKVSESTYHGMFERGQKQGKGVYKWGHDFSEYSGTFEKGQLNGQGRFKLGTCEYIGQWKKGVEIQLNSLSVIKLKKIQKKETLSSLVLDIDNINMK